MSLWSGLINAEAKLFIPHPKVEREKVDSKYLEIALRKEFGEDAIIYLVDYDYHLIDVGEMRNFLAEDKTNLAKYVPEYHDCDDFSFRLMGQVSTPGWSDIAFGIVFAHTPEGEHAVNCFVSATHAVLLIEPQTDEIMAKPENWQVFFCLI